MPSRKPATLESLSLLASHQWDRPCIQKDCMHFEAHSCPSPPVCAKQLLVALKIQSFRMINQIFTAAVWKQKDRQYAATSFPCFQMELLIH